MLQLKRMFEDFVHLNDTVLCHQFIACFSIFSDKDVFVTCLLLHVIFKGVAGAEGAPGKDGLVGERVRIIALSLFACLLWS